MPTEAPISKKIDAPGVSVIVVSFNTCPELETTLSRIESHHEVIVVDNASSDGSAKMVREKFPNIKLIEAGNNLGFGAANNVGLRHATHPLTLFLNSDCYPFEGAIDNLALAFENPEIVVAGGALFHPNGKLQNSAANMLNLWHVFLEQSLLEKLIGGYWVKPMQDSTTLEEVGQVMGACMMIRTGSAKFDESFFLYCEDTELENRLKKETGRKIVYVPKAMFTHELGASSKGADRWVAVARYNRGKELYFRIHFGIFQAWICWWMNRFGALLRLGIWSLLSLVTLFQMKSISDQIGLWGNVVTAPLSGPPRPTRTEP